ncbi:MAG: hypothetical protein E7063_04295 [Spirochaetaceae bacterium]|nr:hypothetical protein [Spirochaetaceae bacterium]
MNNVLSGLERDIVVSYLCDGEIPFTLVPSQPAEKIYSLTTGNSGIKVLSQGIFLFSDSFVLPVNLVGTSVEIRFYFRKLGLSFTNSVYRTKAGALAIAIPKEILRLPDAIASVESPFTCRLFLGEAFSGECLDCGQKEGFPLFVPQTWHLLSENPSRELEKLMEKFCKAVPVEVPDSLKNLMCRTGKGILSVQGKLLDDNPFPSDSCITTETIKENSEIQKDVSSLASGFYFVTGGSSSVTGKTYWIKDIIDHQYLSELFPVFTIAMFLSGNEVATSLQDRFANLQVLYVSSSEIVFAAESGHFQLQKEVEYSILLQVPMGSLRRTITLVCSVDEIYQKDNKTCALCRLSSVKAEDQRFLYESLNGTRYT